MDIYQHSVKEHYGHSSILKEFPKEHFEKKPLNYFVPVIKENFKVQEKFTAGNEEEESDNDSGGDDDDDPLYVNLEDYVEIVPESDADVVCITESSEVEFSDREHKNKVKGYKNECEEITKSVICSEVKTTGLNYSVLCESDPAPRGRSSSSISQQSSSTNDSTCENFKFYTTSDSTDYISSESSESHSSQEINKVSKKFVSQRRQPTVVQETKYRRQRDRNNEASRKSRLKRKLNLQILHQQAADQEEHNKLLKFKVAKLEKINKRFRELILHLSSSQKK